MVSRWTWNFPFLEYFDYEIGFIPRLSLFHICMVVCSFYNLYNSFLRLSLVLCDVPVILNVFYVLLPKLDELEGCICIYVKCEILTSTYISRHLQFYAGLSFTQMWYSATGCTSIYMSNVSIHSHFFASVQGILQFWSLIKTTFIWSNGLQTQSKL